jgi:hypothetical protein
MPDYRTRRQKKKVPAKAVKYAEWEFGRVFFRQPKKNPGCMGEQ